MSSIINIFTGWRNLVNYDSLTPEIKAMADKRGAICIKCPHLIKSTRFKQVESIIDGISRTVKVPEIMGMKCEICGCGFRAKILTPAEQCPFRDGKDLPNGKGSYISVKLENGKTVMGKAGFHGKPTPKWTAEK